MITRDANVHKFHIFVVVAYINNFGDSGLLGMVRRAIGVGTLHGIYARKGRIQFGERVNNVCVMVFAFDKRRLQRANSGRFRIVLFAAHPAIIRQRGSFLLYAHIEHISTLVAESHDMKMNVGNRIDLIVCMRGRMKWMD
jgi:hypothetical protein